MLFILAFLVLLTVAAYYNDSARWTDESQVARLASPAAMMVSYHASLARYCAANDCTAAGTQVPLASLRPFMPSFAQGSPAYDVGYRNVSAGSFVVTYYVGRYPVADTEGVRAQVMAELNNLVGVGDRTAVGVYNGAGQMQPNGYRYDVGLPSDQGGRTKGVLYAAIPVAAAAPAGTPMIATRIKPPTGFNCAANPAAPGCAI